GLELYEPRFRRDLQRVAHSLAVTSALRDPARADPAERIRIEIERAFERTSEVFDALGALLVPVAGPPEERMRITAGLRASDDRWLPVELAGERLADAIAGIAFAAERIRDLGGDEEDRKSTRLNSSHRTISYAVFSLNKIIAALNATQQTDI